MLARATSYGDTDVAVAGGERHCRDAKKGGNAKSVNMLASRPDQPDRNQQHRKRKSAIHPQNAAPNYKGPKFCILRIDLPLSALLCKHLSPEKLVVRVFERSRKFPKGFKLDLIDCGSRRS